MLTNEGFHHTMKALATLSNGGRLIGPVAEQALVNLCHAQNGLLFGGNREAKEQYGRHYMKRLAQESARASYYALEPQSVRLK